MVILYYSCYIKYKRRRKLFNIFHWKSKFWSLKSFCTRRRAAHYRIRKRNSYHEYKWYPWWWLVQKYFRNRHGLKTLFYYYGQCFTYNLVDSSKSQHDGPRDDKILFDAWHRIFIIIYKFTSDVFTNIQAVKAPLDLKLKLILIRFDFKNVFIIQIL